MTEQPRSFRHRFPTLAFAVIAAGLTGLAAKAVDGEGDLAAGFTTAIGQTAMDTAEPARRLLPPQVGNEAFWLDKGGKPNDVKPAHFAPPSSVAIGDRFELSGATGKRMLEVYEVRSIDGTGMVASEYPGKPQYLVSLRVVGSEDETVRLMIDGDGPLAGLVPLGRSADRLL